MPALLSEVYGTTFGQVTERARGKYEAVRPIDKVVKSDKAITKGGASPLGTAATSEESSPVIISPVVHARPTMENRAGNYEVHVTIDRHDCHLLCLFIGVFALSVLFKANKPRYPPIT